MRFKHRYFLCELVLEDPRQRHVITQGTVYHNVKEIVARLHGDFGVAAVSVALSVKYLNAYTGIIFIRSLKNYHKILGSSLPFITSLENRGQRYPCFINTLHIAGTIRSCQRFLIQYNREQLDRLLRNCTNPSEKENIRQSIVSCTLKSVEESEFTEDEEME
ncbi:ribonuclease P/MRP protein subunit POP5 [Pyxicephalus adspersus]|uniref:Ribonuclease P/MRP protein subunit POP5 n=1 Tax=Pyxicephalus adspersus TaxID=30357 RepID=A0AAV3AJH9_PYXAD|nr:TPA: hypothetical protein GDO54_013943 [Pyxicephalus adspersus]